MWSNGRADSIELRINWHFKWESVAVQKGEPLREEQMETALHWKYMGSGHVEAQNG